MRQRTKDGAVLWEHEIRAQYPSISFAAHTYDELGWAPYVAPVYVPTLADLAQRKHADISTWRDEQERGTLVWDGRTWQADPVSRERLGMVLAAFSTYRALPEGFFWTDADNNDVPVQFGQLETLLQEVVAQGFAIHARQRQMKNEVTALANAGDREGVAGYPVGWPES